MLRGSLSISFFLQLLASTFAFSTSPPHADALGNNARILQDVLKDVYARQNWSLDGIRFSRLGVKKVRLATAQSFEFRIRFGKNRFVFMFPDERSSWRKIAGGDVDFAETVKESRSAALLDPVVIEGPIELRVVGDERASLSLPMNISRMGLKRVLVGKGILIEVRNATEVSLSRSIRIGTLDGGGALRDRKVFGIWNFTGDGLCTQFPLVQVVGSASLRAYRSHNPDSIVKTSFLSRDAIELLSEKCYSDYLSILPSTFDLIGLKLGRLEKVLSTLGARTGKMGSGGGSISVKRKASTIIHFLLEIERTVGFNDSGHKALSEWRTKSDVERVWYEVSARAEIEKLKPLTLKKVAPFTVVDSVTWSNLLSNVSFTKFPSILVPQEALTLDVKW